MGCGSQEQPARQAPPVTVGKPTVGPAHEYAIFTGFSRAVESADVVARVAGALETALTRQWDRSAIQGYARENAWERRVEQLEQIFRSMVNT